MLGGLWTIFCIPIMASEIWISSLSLKILHLRHWYLLTYKNDRWENHLCSKQTCRIDTFGQMKKTCYYWKRTEVIFKTCSCCCQLPIVTGNNRQFWNNFEINRKAGWLKTLYWKSNQHLFIYIDPLISWKHFTNSFPVYFFSYNIGVSCKKS